jgi:hypothetical protein
MNFFSKERDLVHRIANLILILWLVISIFICYSSLIDIFVKKPLLNYEEYKVQSCGKYVPTEDRDDIDYCEQQYEQYKINDKNENYNDKKSLINAIGNVIIVSTFLFLLNRK